MSMSAPMPLVPYPGSGRQHRSNRKSRPPKLRSRYVVLEQAHGKSPKDRLFTASHGKPRRDMWAQEIRSAIALHNKRARVEAILERASAFRRARISELLQVYGVDPLTAQTGTSLRMIERAYFKFIRSAMLQK